jgi:hypothetical protein
MALVRRVWFYRHFAAAITELHHYSWRRLEPLVCLRVFDDPES